MKPTTRCGPLLALFCCLLSLLSSPTRAQGVRPLPTTAAALAAPRLAPAGTVLTEAAVLFTRPAYDALRADYAWLNQAVGLKNQRLAAAAAVDTTTMHLLSQAQAEVVRARAAQDAAYLSEQQTMTKYARAVAQQRPFLLFDKRLYLGGGLGLGVGVLGTAYLLARFR